MKEFDFKNLSEEDFEKLSIKHGDKIDCQLLLSLIYRLGKVLEGETKESQFAFYSGMYHRLKEEMEKKYTPKELAFMTNAGYSIAKIFDVSEVISIQDLQRQEEAKKMN